MPSSCRLSHHNAQWGPSSQASETFHLCVSCTPTRRDRLSSAQGLHFVHHGQPGSDSWHRAGTFVFVSAGDVTLLQWEASTEVLRCSGPPTSDCARARCLTRVRPRDVGGSWPPVYGSAELWSRAVPAFTSASLAAAHRTHLPGRPWTCGSGSRRCRRGRRLGSAGVINRVLPGGGGLLDRRRKSSSLLHPQAPPPRNVSHRGPPAPLPHPAAIH